MGTSSKKMDGSSVAAAIDNKKTLYTQCGLAKGHRHMVSWIPAKFGKAGQVLKLKREDDTWDDGWIVEWTGTTADVPEDSRKTIRNHRRATGDSLPKIKEE